MKIRIVVGMLVAAIITGCSSAPPRYESDVEKNLTVNLDMDISSGLFSSVDVALGINDMDKQCQSHYKGIVPLQNGQTEVGLKVGQMTYLIIEIVRSSRSNSSSFSRGTLLIPEPGKQYAIDAVYKDNMYDFRLYDVTGSKREPMPLLPGDACEAG